jgi:hypothetical protein
MSGEKLERVLIHTFDGSQWSKSVSEISIEKEPFAKGMVEWLIFYRPDCPSSYTNNPHRCFPRSIQIDPASSACPQPSCLCLQDGN